MEDEPEKKVKTTTGKDIDVGCDIICVHSDTPNAVEIITKLNNAIKNGAKAIVCNKLPKSVIEGITYVIVNNTVKALGILASNFYDNPSEKLNLIGITGTNGKTSVADLFNQILTLNKIPVASIGTLGIKLKGKLIKSNLTSPVVLIIFSGSLK